MILTSKAEFPVTFGEITIPKGQDHLTAEERDEGYVSTLTLSDDQLATLKLDADFVGMVIKGDYTLSAKPQT